MPSPTTSVVVPATPADVLYGDVEDPVDRAERRFAALQSRFADILAVLAAMYSDEDWRFLRKDDGTTYTGFSELVATALSCSASYARRVKQGMQTLYLPLQEIVVEGTAIEITSKDVAILGAGGAREVVCAVGERAQVTEATPQAHAELISEVIDEVKEQRQKPSSSSGGTDDFAHTSEPVASPHPATDTPPWDTTDGSIDSPQSSPLPVDRPHVPESSKPKKQKTGPTPDVPSDDTEYVPTGRSVVVEPLDTSIEGHRTFDTDVDVADLPTDELRRFRRALNELQGLNAETLAAAITSETRGVLNDSNIAAALITQVRTLVKAHAEWVPR